MTLAGDPAIGSLSGVDPRDLEEIVGQLGTTFIALRDARIVVSGATGWFGTWLLDALVALNRHGRLGLRIVAISRSPVAFRCRLPALHNAPEIEWLAADVRDPGLTVDGVVTHVVHAAADSHAPSGDRQAVAETIVAGTGNLLRLAARHPGTRMLFVSSGAVYGRQPAYVERLSESRVPLDDATGLDDAYATAKREAERLVARGEVDAVVARCFAFVGPHMPFDAHFAIGNFIRDALVGERIDLSGDGKALRSYLYMTDFVVWLLTMLISGEAGRAYNIGSPEPVSMERLARRCSEIVGQSVPVRVNDRAAPGRNYVPDVERATTELGLRVRVPLEDAIARTVRWRRMTLARDLPLSDLRVAHR